MSTKQFLLFDVDGTLTKPMLPIDPDFKDLLCKLKDKYVLGVVGGSNLEKIAYQLGPTMFDDYDYIFAENGLVAYKGGILIEETKLSNVLKESDLESFIHYIAYYINKLDIPIKRTGHIEIRSGMINISPIGRNCSYEERVMFCEYDKIHKIRETMIEELKRVFAHLNLVYCIGGMISFDVYPYGWDKTYCLKYLNNYPNISFFGDKTDIGGNDYELYKHPRVTGYKVSNWNDTQTILMKQFII